MVLYTIKNLLPIKDILKTLPLVLTTTLKFEKTVFYNRERTRLNEKR